MKHNFIFFVLLISGILYSTFAYADDMSISNIQKRGTLYCGTNKNNKDLAYKDEDGVWRGFDAVMCRAIASALLGKKERFEMVPMRMEDAPKNLKIGKIDVMFGEFSLPAEMEISSNTFNVDVLYHEKVMLLAHKIKDAESMKAYKSSKVCITRNSIDTYFLKNFNDKYKLDLKPLYFANRDRATEAFYLNRCMLLPGASNELKKILSTKFKGKDYIEILPETIGLRPVYVMVDKNSANLAVTVKWIINALRLAEIYDITSNNLPMMLGEQDNSAQNLLGNQPELWQKFNIYPTWMRKFITEEGNYGEIYEKNLGPDTELGLDKILPERGLATPRPFI